MSAWGVVRDGVRGFVALERLGGGRYRGRPTARLGRTGTLVDGDLAHVRTRSLAYPTDRLAAREVERLNRRPFDAESDRWNHLDG